MIRSPRLRSLPFGKESPPGSIERDDPPLPLPETPGRGSPTVAKPEPEVGFKKGGRSDSFPLVNHVALPKSPEFVPGLPGVEKPISSAFPVPLPPELPELPSEPPFCALSYSHSTILVELL